MIVMGKKSVPSFSTMFWCNSIDEIFTCRNLAKNQLKLHEDDLNDDIDFITLAQ